MGKTEFSVHAVDLNKGTANVSMSSSQGFASGSTITFTSDGKTLAQFKGSGKIKQTFPLKGISKDAKHITATITGASGDTLTHTKCPLTVAYNCPAPSCRPRKCEPLRRCCKQVVLIGAWDSTSPFPVQDSGDAITNIPDGPSALLARLVLTAAGWTEGLDFRIVEAAYGNFVNFEDGSPGPLAYSDHLAAQMTWAPVLRRLGQWDYGLPAAPTPVPGELRLLSNTPESAVDPPISDAVIAYVGGYSLQPGQLAGLGYTAEAGTQFVDIPDQSPESLQQAIDAGANLLYAFTGVVYDPEREGAVVATIPAVSNFYFAPLLNKGHPCHDELVLAWYVGMRRIVNSNEYQQYVNATVAADVEEFVGWTPETFPDLIHPRVNVPFEAELSLLLQNRVLYESLECLPAC